MTHMLGNIGSGFGRIAGTSVGMAAGASIGQSAGLVGGAATSTVVMPAEETALGQGTGPGGQRGQQRRGLEQQAEAKQEQESRRQRRRQRQQQSTQPLEDATIGLAGASGIGLGTGFAIGTSAGAAAGRQYGEMIGQEVGLWLINNLNFAVAYFGVLGLANLLNGIDLIVTNGISKVKIQKLIRSQIRKSENQIFQDFTSIYNSTVYADFANLESESGVFRSTVDAFGGMGALFGFAAGMPAGAAVSASSGGIYGSSGAGTASGAAQAAGARTRAPERRRRRRPKGLRPSTPSWPSQLPCGWAPRSASVRGRPLAWGQGFLGDGSFRARLATGWASWWSSTWPKPLGCFSRCTARRW